MALRGDEAWSRRELLANYFFVNHFFLDVFDGHISPPNLTPYPHTLLLSTHRLLIFHHSYSFVKKVNRFFGGDFYHLWES